MSKKLKYPLERSECLCPICREILLEPVTLPCRHTLCHPCFKLTVEKSSLYCPFCRLRVSVWSRYNTRAGTLVNKELWELIQRQYPEECNRRATGEDTEQDELEDDFGSYPMPLICKPGEIRQEYEAEISKIEAERLKREEEERKASEEYIKKLLAEEEEERSLCQEPIQRELEEQLKRDEEIAWMLNHDLNESSTSSANVSLESPVASKQKVELKSCKKAKARSSQSGDIERFLSPNPKSATTVHADPLNVSLSSSSSAVTLLDSDEDAMPILSPQIMTPLIGRPIENSDVEPQLPCLTKYSPTLTDVVELPTPGSSRSKHAGNEEQLGRAAIDFCTPRSSKSHDGYWNVCSMGRSTNITNTPEQGLNETPEIYLQSLGFVEDCRIGNDLLVSYLESSSAVGSPAERLKQLEECLNQRKVQEEQDRLVALKLQKLLDKEQQEVSRQKGSPDEYKLRLKIPHQQQLKRHAPEGSMMQPKEDGAESGSTSDENKKPPTKKRLSLQARSNKRATSVESALSDGVKVLRPSNRQQTILDMFQKSSGK